MKKILLPVILFTVFIFSANAQEKRFNLYGGYVFDENFDSYYSTDQYYNGKIKGGFQYGGGIEFMTQPDFGVELLYIGQMTHAPTTYDAGYVLGYKSSNLDLNLNYAMLGFTRHMQQTGSKVEGYGGLLLGCLFATAKDPNSGVSANGEKFSWGLRLGGNIWASDKIGIKMQAQLLSAVQSVGGSFYFGTGGSGVAVNSYSSMYQFSFTTGLTFRLGGK